MRAPVALVSLLVASIAFAAEIPLAEPSIVPADTKSYTRSDPQVTAGDGFLVVWTERLFGAHPGPIVARAYDENGVPRRPFAAAVASDHDPRVVWTGTEYLMVHATQVSRFGAPIDIPVVVAVRLRVDGTVVEGSQVTLAQGRSSASVISLAWDGDEALAYFVAEGMPRLLRLNGEGRVKVDESVSVRSKPAMVAAAPNAPMYFLRPEDGDVAAVAPGEIAIVDHTSVGVVVTLLDGSRRQRDAFVVAPAGVTIRSLAWDGSAWNGVYAKESEVCTIRFADRSVTTECETKTNPRVPSIAVGRFRTFKAWARGWEQIETDGELASMVQALQGVGGATTDESGLLVAWLEDGRIRLGGLPPRPSSFVAHVTNATTVRVSGSLVVWIENGTVNATHTGAAGAPGPPVLQLGESVPVGPLAVATNGRDWLVAWKQGSEIVATRVSQNLITTGVEHFGAPGVSQFFPQVAATPVGFLVAWTEEEIVDRQSRTRVVAERLDANGLRVSGGIRLTDFAGNSAVSLRPALGCGAANCIVTWGPTAVLPVGFDAQPLGELKTILGAGSVQKLVIPRSDGTFDVYDSYSVTSVRADGTPIAARNWMSPQAASSTLLTLGAVVDTRAVYSRIVDGVMRVFVRDLAMRARAARHGS